MGAMMGHEAGGHAAVAWGATEACERIGYASDDELIAVAQVSGVSLDELDTLRLAARACAVACLSVCERPRKT